tara:strand:- start:671 stop:1141 length:471 start_codon:yes stop_codon:yes gene_type:complete
MKNLNRLIYTISNQNKPNQLDVEALNNVIKYYNDERKRTLTNNKLFAKLFVGVFKGDLIKSNGNYKLSLDTLKMMLKIDIEEHYNGFHNEINQIEFEKLCDYLEIPEVKTLSDDQKKDIIIEDNKELLYKVLDKYSKEKVYDRLNNLMIDLIEDNS